MRLSRRMEIAKAAFKVSLRRAGKYHAKRKKTKRVKEKREKKKKKKKKEKEKSKYDEGRGTKRKRRSRSREAKPVQLSQYLHGEEKYSVISGKKIKLKVDKTKEDREADRNRQQLLEFLNASYD
eukprot:jgi/Botrbrau1/621/Bobra.0161s0014.2